MFAILEKIIYIKKNEDWNKVRLFIGVAIAFLLFLLSYFVTDTSIGMFYAFLSISTFMIIFTIDSRSSIGWARYSSAIIGLPLMSYLLIKAISHMLINPQYIILLLIIMNAILCYSYKRKKVKGEIIALIIGLLISGILIYFQDQSSGVGGRAMIKQELVAQRYLEEKLDIHDAHAYTDRLQISIRGEKTKVEAYDASGTLIKMIYKDNNIISYNIEKSK